MKKLTSKIKIGKYSINGIVELSIESSWANLTDTCSLTFPRQTNWKGRNIAFGDSLFRRGDQVIISLGYDGEKTVRFEGFLHLIHANIPPTLECQDAMWKLKNSTVTKSFKEVTLKDLLSAILNPIAVPFEAPTVRLGQFRISKATPAQVLEELRKTYFLKSWFRDGKLYVGLAYLPELQSEHRIKFERNVISDDLQYVRQEDVKIKLKVISMLPNNQKLEFEFGDNDGEQRTLHFYDKKEEEIKFIANQEIERLRYEGYRGNFTTFLIPKIQHGDLVNLESESYPERNGRYLVKKVTTTFGVNGGRQIVEIDTKL